MKKIIFLDIDGTIRNFDGRIPESAVDAIVRARANGHYVCISSGRPLSQIAADIKKIGFDGMITGAGSYVTWRDECVHSVCFEQEEYIDLCTYLIENGCLIEIQKYDITGVPMEVKEAYFEMQRNMLKGFGVDPDEVMGYLTTLEDYRIFTGAEKILFFSNHLSYDEVMKVWGERIHMTNFSIPNSETKWGGEITPLNVFKTAGIRSILDHIGFSREDVIAIGDSDNDIDMLEFAAVGVAMGNGTVGAKAAADFVTDAVMEDGLQHAFEKLNLIN